MAHVEWCSGDEKPRVFKFALPKPMPVAKLVKRCAKNAGASPAGVAFFRRDDGVEMAPTDLVPVETAWYRAVPPTTRPSARAPPPEPPEPRYAEWLRGRAVPRVSGDDEATISAYIARREPVIIEGGCGITRSVAHWSFDYLAKNSDRTFAHYHTHYAPKSRRVFPRKYGKKVMVGERAAEEGGILSTTFAQFVEVLEESRASKTDPYAYYCQQTILTNKSDRPPWDLTNRPPPPAEAAPFSGDHPFLEDLYAADWGWLHRVTKSLGTYFMTSLWCGDGESVTPIHYDCKDNLLCQIRGTKHVLLFPCARAFDLYPYPLDHPMTEFTMVDLEKPDVKRWPAFASLRGAGLHATLGPGDVLLIPRFTWHFVQQCSPNKDNLSMNFWFGGYTEDLDDLQDINGVERGDAARGRCDLATRRVLAYRLVEWIAKASLEPVDVDFRRFLTLWAERGDRVFAERLYCNLKSFAGALVARVSALLGGEGAFHALLRDMTQDGRLFPGPPKPTVESSGEENQSTPRARLPLKLRRLLRVEDDHLPGGRGRKCVAAPADACASDTDDDPVDGFAGLDG